MQRKINIYQALVRLFGNRNNTNKPHGSFKENGCGKLSDFTKEALESIAQLGCNYIWYTGIIEHACKTTHGGRGNASKCLVKGEAGSPYAIVDYYRVHPDIVSSAQNGVTEFEELIERSHQAGLSVIMDFVPNHVAREYRPKIKAKDCMALGCNDHNEYAFHPQNNFYYLPNTHFFPHIGMSESEFCYYEEPAKATGNDCFSPNPSIYDWYETIKLNYGIDHRDGSKHFNPTPDTWNKMLDILLYWASKKVDGFRCDMAHMVPQEFWHWAIAKVKAQYPQVIFIAELYDQNLYHSFITYAGFDYLYDKMGFYDTVKNILINGWATSSITHVWQRNEGIQHHMLNFMENHDEERLASTPFAQDPQKGIPAMMLAAWMNKNGTLIYFGQELGEDAPDSEGFSGNDGRTSIFDYWCIDKMRRYNHDGKWDEELLSEQERALRENYSQILNLALKEDCLSKGTFYDLMYANYDNYSFDSNHLFAFIRKYEDKLTLVVLNFSDEEKECSVFIPAHLFEHFCISPNHCAYTELMSQEQGFAHINPETPFICTLSPYSGKAYKFNVKC